MNQEKEYFSKKNAYSSWSSEKEFVPLHLLFKEYSHTVLEIN